MSKWAGHFAASRPDRLPTCCRRRSQRGLKIAASTLDVREGVSGSRDDWGADVSVPVALAVGLERAVRREAASPGRSLDYSHEVRRVWLGALQADFSRNGAIGVLLNDGEALRRSPAGRSYVAAAEGVVEERLLLCRVGASVRNGTNSRRSTNESNRVAMLQSYGDTTPVPTTG